jgi:hypothetical protein
MYNDERASVGIQSGRASVPSLRTRRWRVETRKARYRTLNFDDTYWMERN